MLDVAAFPKKKSVYLNFPSFTALRIFPMDDVTSRPYEVWKFSL